MPRHAGSKDIDTVLLWLAGALSGPPERIPAPAVRLGRPAQA